jgi:hypothetical protein
LTSELPSVRLLNAIRVAPAHLESFLAEHKGFRRGHNLTLSQRLRILSL